MSAWLIERGKNLLFYGPVIVVACLVIGFTLYSAFIKPTNKTNQKADSISNSLSGATVNVGLGGCAHFSGYPKDKK